MLTFVEFLSELASGSQTISIPKDDVEQLVSRFGPDARQIGVWRHATDGSLEVAVAEIAEAARLVGDAVLSEAVRELRSSQEFAGMLGETSAAARLIAELGRIHRQRFEEKVRRYQDAKDPAEVQRLASEISHELFGA
jgi:hypothetical protein